MEVAFVCVSPVHRGLPAAGVDCARWAPRPSQGIGDPCAPPRAVDPSPASGAAAFRAARSTASVGVEPDAAAPLVERFLGTARDAPALASPAGRSALDPSAPTSGAAADQPWRTGA